MLSTASSTLALLGTLLLLHLLLLLVALLSRWMITFFLPVSSLLIAEARLIGALLLLIPCCI